VYCAVNVCEPAAENEFAKVAVPVVLRLLAPTATLPFLRITVPVGVGQLVEELTTTVKELIWPTAAVPDVGGVIVGVTVGVLAGRRSGALCWTVIRFDDPLIWFP